MNIGDLVATLRVNDRDYNQRVDRAGARFATMGQRVQGAAARAGQHLTTIGTRAAGAAQRANTALGGIPGRVLTPIGSAAVAAGQRVQGAFAPAFSGIRAGFTGAAASGGAFQGVMHRVGSTAGTVAGTATTMGGAFSRGFRGPTVEATALQSRMAAVGGATRTAMTVGASAAASMGSRIRSAADSSRASMGGLGDSVRGVGTQIGLLAGAVGIAKIGSDVTRLTSQLDNTRRVMEGLYGDTRTAGDMMDRLAKLSSSSSLGHEQFLAAGESLAYLNISGERAEKMLMNLDAATTVAGSGAQGMESALYALTGATNSGRVQLNHLNQISQAGVPIFDQLQSQFGKTAEEVKQMASDGEISVADLEQAFETASGPLWTGMVEASGNATASLSNQWEIFRGNFVTGVATALVPAVESAGAAFVSLNERVGPFFTNLPKHIETAKAAMAQWGITDALANIGEHMRTLAQIAGPFLQGAFIGLAAAIGGAVHILSMLLDVISPLTGFLAENEWITRSLGVAFGLLGGILLTYKVAMATAAAVTWLMQPALQAVNLAMTLYRSTLLRTAAMHAVTLAGMLAKATAWAVAMAAKWLIAMGPIGWIVAAVAAAVALIIIYWDEIKVALDRVVQWFTELPAMIGEALTWLGETVANGARAAWEWLSTTASEAIEAAVTWLLELPQRAAYALGFLAGQVYNGALAAWRFISETLPQWIEAAIAWISALPGRVGSWLASLGSTVLTGAQNAWRWLRDKAIELGNAALDWISALPGRVGSFLASLPGIVRNAASSAWQGFLSTTQSLAQSAMSFIGSLPGRIMGFFSNAGSWLVSAGRNIVQGLLNGIYAMAQNALNYVRNLGSQIAAGFKAAVGISSPSKVFASFGTDIGRGLMVGMQDIAPKVIAKTSDLAEDATRAASTKVASAEKLLRQLGLEGLSLTGDGSALPGQGWLSRARDEFDRRRDRGDDGGGTTVNVEINNPKAERASDAVNRSARTLAALGPFG